MNTDGKKTEETLTTKYTKYTNGEKIIQPIDRLFRLTVDFCVVWALLVVPVFLLTNKLDMGPWYAYVGILILLPLFATFALYGPILLVRQVVSSGLRGWFVLRIFLSIVLVGALLFFGLYFSGHYSEGKERMLAFLFAGIATAYLQWRLEK